MANVKVFKTEAGQPGVEVAGVGYMGPDGKGGIRVDRAAEVMSELQERDDEGRLVLDDANNPKPLTGNALSKAVSDLAEARGWKVASLSEEKADALAQELGVAAERPPLAEVSKEAYEDAGYADLEPENTPEEMSDIGGDEEAPAPVTADDDEATA